MKSCFDENITKNNLQELQTSNIKIISEFLRKFLDKVTWRTNSSSDWLVIPAVSQKSTSGFVGLNNLGATCYMNSLL